MLSIIWFLNKNTFANTGRHLSREVLVLVLKKLLLTGQKLKRLGIVGTMSIES